MKIYLKILIHTIYWLVYLMFSFVLGTAKSPDAWHALSSFSFHYVINFIWALSAFYLFYFYFIRYFESKQFVLYLLFSITISVLITFLFLPVHKLILPQFNILSIKVYGPPIAGTFIIVQCGCLVRGFENWFTHVQVKAELENKNLQNELELLKSQINPHFLFNTLNNIDSLIHSNTENASASLITLSDLLRYMIYETKSERVPLNKELKYMQNYINLQQLRFRNKDYIKYSFAQSCDNVVVAPMLFIPFVENAFKYADYKDNYPVVDIQVMCNQETVSFCCINYCGGNLQIQNGAGGVGLSNVKRRLELLYPKKHKLSIFNENHIFKVELTIDLG